jgi:hypothetical protein
LLIFLFSIFAGAMPATFGQLPRARTEISFFEQKNRLLAVSIQ